MIDLFLAGVIFGWLLRSARRTATAQTERQAADLRAYVELVSAENAQLRAAPAIECGRSMQLLMRQAFHDREARRTV